MGILATKTNRIVPTFSSDEARWEAVVRRDRAADHVLAQTIAGVDQHHVPEAGIGVQSEEDAGGAEVGAHHLLHADGEGDVAMREAVLDADLPSLRRLPDGTEPAIISKLNEAIQTAMDQDDVRERFEALNLGLARRIHGDDHPTLSVILDTYAALLRENMNGSIRRRQELTTTLHIPELGVIPPAKPKRSIATFGRGKRAPETVLEDLRRCHITCTSGLPMTYQAIATQLLKNGEIDVSLLFSTEHYLGAAEAYLRGVERRVDAEVQLGRAERLADRAGATGRSRGSGQRRLVRGLQAGHRDGLRRGQ